MQYICREINNNNSNNSNNNNRIIQTTHIYFLFVCLFFQFCCSCCSFLYVSYHKNDRTTCFGTLDVTKSNTPLKTKDRNVWLGLCAVQFWKSPRMKVPHVSKGNPVVWLASVAVIFFSSYLNGIYFQYASCPFPVHHGKSLTLSFP